MAAKTFQGRPCKRGHDGMRYASATGPCVECSRLRNNGVIKPKPRPEKAAKPKPAKRHQNKKPLAGTLSPKKAPKGIRLTKRPGASRKYIDLIKPPPTELDRKETPDEFVARGGRIQQVPVGATGIKE